MDPEEIEYFRNLKREERRYAVPSLIKNLEERSLGHSKKNVTSKEYRELLAEELLIEKDKYDELCCDMPGMPRSTFLMVFSPDGTKVASTHGNHNIYVSDLRSGKNLNTLIGHPRTPWCIAFHPTSNQIVASGCLGGQVRIWDLSGGSEVWTATNQTVIASIAFHPLERILVIATSNEVYFWDWSQPEPFMHTSTGSHKEKVRYVAFDKLGHKLITGISNSHSRWEYVRSSERTYEPPMRHFNIASRRPVLRRGLFPTRQNISLSSSSNVPRETQSRVPERERNITISYRNLVRQYGRLVQRYLQLYRPPAMIDRGTDPMENFVPSSSNDNSELQESNSSTNTTDVREPDTSNDTASLQEPNTCINTTNSEEPNVSNNIADLQQPSVSNSTVVLQEPNFSNNIENLQKPNSSNNIVDLQDTNVSNNTAVLQEPNSYNNIEELQEPNRTENSTELQQELSNFSNGTELQDSGSSNILNSPSPSGLDQTSVSPQSNNHVETERCMTTVQVSDPSTVVPSIPKKHKKDTAPQDHIPRKKIKKSTTDHGDHSLLRSESPQPGTSGLLNQPSEELNCQEMIMNVLRSAASASLQCEDRNNSNDIETNQEPSAQRVVLETESRESTIQTEEHVENSTEVQNNQDCNISFGDQLENSSENTGNNEEPTTPENQRGIPWFNPSVIATPRVETERRSDQGQDQNSRVPSRFSRTLGRITRSRTVYNLGTGQPHTDIESNEPLMLSSFGPSSLVEGTVPGTSSVSEHRRPGEDQVLENMMMNMRRNAEDNLRARFMPVIRSRVPENDREELIRLFEECVRDSRERARLRYRNMGQTIIRQPNQRPFVFESSDSSSSEDERDSLHMNFYIRSRNDNSSRTTESSLDTGSINQRSRGSGVPSGNSSLHNINNLESWVTSLFNDVDSASANANETSRDTAQTFNNRSTSMNINSLLDRPPRMNSHTSSRNRINPNTSINNTSSSLPESPSSSPPNPVGNTSTGTTNSTSYSLARRRLGNFGSFLRSRIYCPRTTQDFRRIRTFSSGRWRMNPGQSQRPQVFGIRPLSSPTVINNFPRDEVINFSEFPNSEDDPFLAPERSEPLPSSSSESFHPFNPPPNLPAINPENIGIGNMYSNIVQDLEASLNNARDSRTVDRPGEMSNMLSNFSNRLETLMNQSEGILRNLRTSVDVLPDNDPIEYAEEAPVPTASFNDSTFFVRDQRTEGTSSPARNFSDPLGYDIHQNDATSDHTYPRNSESANSSSNLNETMSPLMSSLHLTLSHIQSQSRLLHRQVECIERIDRAMVEVAQLQLMRLLLVELSTYVRNLSGESRSTSMSSVRQMMAGTRISDSSPGDNQNSTVDDGGPICDPGPSTSSGSRGTHHSSPARSRGVTRKTYPPSRLNRPRDLGYARSIRNSQDQPSPVNPPPLPSVAPPHTYSQINLFTLIRMDRRLQSLIDDHSTRFSYLNEHFPTSNTRRQFNEVGEHTLALRLRESINRTNRLLGNIFHANVVRNFRIDSSTSLRHGIERYYERTLLSLIIDGISSHLDTNRTSRIPSDIRTRMQNVLQLAMMMSDLLLLYTINSFAPTTVSDVNLDTERNILANRVSETCTTMIQCRQYRNFSNIFVTSLRSLRLMVSTYCSSNYARFANRRREYLRSQLTQPFIVGSFEELNDVVDRGHISSRGAHDNASTARESTDNRGREHNDSNVINETRPRQPSNRRGREVFASRTREVFASRTRETGGTRGGRSSDNTPNNSPLINACLYLARRQRAQHQSTSRQISREAMTQHLRNILRENRIRAPTTNTDSQNSQRQQEPSPLSQRQQEPSLMSQRQQETSSLSQRQQEPSPLSQRSQEPSPLSQSSGAYPLTNEGNGRTRRRNSTDVLINAYLTAGQNRTENQLESNQTSEPDLEVNVNRNTPSTDTSSNHIYRGLAHTRSFIEIIRPTQHSTENSSQNTRSTGRTRIFNPHHFLRNEQINSTLRSQNSEADGNRRTERVQSAEPEAVGSNLDITAWWENAVEHLTSETSGENRRNMLFGSSSHESPLLPRIVPPVMISPMRSRSSTTNNTSEASEPQRAWRIPSVQVNDVPIELGPSQESSESDNSPTPGSHNNNNNPTYPRVMARLAAIRSVSVYNPIGVLRPRLLHPLYATLNPFDADLEQREHIYDSDVISTVTPNHRIQVWDISDSNIPDISDPLKNLVVRECKIHNDASVDIASDGSILVTLLPSGGYLNITNRLGIYSLRWETLGQCLYTTSFVHNAVSVSLSPLGRHLVVGLASRRVSLLPNDRWMMASIFKIEEKDTPGDHLPFIRQIDRGTDERATSHKSVNCIRWLPTSGQGLIYATNTGQLNIWT